MEQPASRFFIASAPEAWMRKGGERGGCGGVTGRWGRGSEEKGFSEGGKNRFRAGKRFFRRATVSLMGIASVFWRHGKGRLERITKKAKGEENAAGQS